MHRRSRPLSLALVGLLAAASLAAGPPSQHPGQGQGPDRSERGNAPWNRDGGGGDGGPEGAAPFDYLSQLDRLSQPDLGTTFEEVRRPGCARRCR